MSETIFGEKDFKKMSYKNTKSEAYCEVLKQYLPGGVHYNLFSLANEKYRHFTVGRGSRLWDIDGNEYVDMHCQFGAVILGHGHPKFNEVLVKQINRTIGVNPIDIDCQVVELLCSHIPSFDMVRFAMSGTEAVLNALRLARAWNGRNKFIRFDGHYHGNADSLMGGTRKSDENPVPVDFPGDPRLTAGRARNIRENESFIIPWNDSKMLNSIIEKYGNDIAAIIMEPICINGGGIYPSHEYLKFVRRICDEKEIVLIFDEVITGVRLGLGGAQSLLGVKPDITVLGKAIGNGVPISAFGGRRDIMSLLAKRKVVHAGTFNGHPLGLAAILATFEVLSDNEEYKKMRANAEMVQKLIKEKANNFGIPMVLQGPLEAQVMHCRMAPLESTGDYDLETMVKDGILKRYMADYGILASPVSRLFSTTSMNGMDIEFISEKLEYVFQSVAEAVSDLNFK